MSRTAIAIIAAIAGVSGAVSTWAGTPLSVRDSLRIGNSGTSFCSAQSLTVDKALTGMFDAGYSITCRDAALPVGKLYKIRSSSDAEARLAADRAERATCTAPRRSQVSGLGDVDVIDCKLRDADVDYRAYELKRGGLLYVAEGLGGYDSALQLGLRSLVADQPVKGEISIATTGLGDPAAFARVQAGTLAPDKALAEAYRRNNAGSYAEAAEFFAAVSSARPTHRSSRAEALVNEALQKSNLGRFAEADVLFARAAEHCRQRSDRRPAAAQLSRHARAQPGQAEGRARSSSTSRCRRRRQHRRVRGLEARDRRRPAPSASTPIPSGPAARRRRATSSFPTKRRRSSTARRSSCAAPRCASPAIVKARARRFAAPTASLLAVRGGKVASILWMRAQILGDLAAIAEESGEPSRGRRASTVRPSTCSRPIIRARQPC